jgi:hypothetical protein
MNESEIRKMVDIGDGLLFACGEECCNECARKNVEQIVADTNAANALTSHSIDTSPEWAVVASIENSIKSHCILCN